MKKLLFLTTLILVLGFITPKSALASESTVVVKVYQACFQVKTVEDKYYDKYEWYDGVFKGYKLPAGTILGEIKYQAGSTMSEQAFSVYTDVTGKFTGKNAYTKMIITMLPNKNPIIMMLYTADNRDMNKSQLDSLQYCVKGYCASDWIQNYVDLAVPKNEKSILMNSFPNNLAKAEGADEFTANVNLSLRGTSFDASVGTAITLTDDYVSCNVNTISVYNKNYAWKERYDVKYYYNLRDWCTSGRKNILFGDTYVEDYIHMVINTNQSRYFSYFIEGQFSVCTGSKASPSKFSSANIKRHCSIYYQP